MPARDSAAAWGWVSRLLHWAMAGLILFQLGFGLYMTRVPDLLARFTLTQTHKSWGFVIFVLALLRVGWRLMNRARPPLPAAMPRWQVRAAGLSHALLYVLMFVMPISGWVLASASPVQDLLQMQNLVFGRFALPDPFGPRRRRGRERPPTPFTPAPRSRLAALLALHAGAALKHQFVDRDRVLARMIRGDMKEGRAPRERGLFRPVRVRRASGA